MNARWLATTVLVRVWREGAFAAAALTSEISAVDIEPRDRALATELVYGVLRAERYLRHRVDKLASRSISKHDVITQARILVAAYEVLFLTHVPAFAAVNECVRDIKKRKGPAVGAFVNAVLRALARDPSVDDEDVVSHTFAPWLTQALDASLGPDGGLAYRRASVQRVFPDLCVFDPAARDDIVTTLQTTHGESFCRAGAHSPHAIHLLESGRLEQSRGADVAGDAVEAGDGYVVAETGAWQMQEEGSQLVARALGVRRGDRVLDACAGRGNKALLLASLMERAQTNDASRASDTPREAGTRGELVACDLHINKLGMLSANAQRLGLVPPEVHAVDWTVGSGGVAGTFDRILIDAPCTGIGTLRRRPDLLRKRVAEDPERMGALQKQIASNVTAHLAPGGTLVYAVCSVLREECEDVIDALRAQYTWLVPHRFDDPAVDALAEQTSTLRLLPHVHGTDGYFLACLRRQP